MAKYIQIPENTRNIELAIIDYQDEGYKLEMFCFNRDGDLLDISTIKEGDVMSLMDETEKARDYIEDHTTGIRCNITRHLNTLSTYANA